MVSAPPRSRKVEGFLAPRLNGRHGARVILVLPLTRDLRMLADHAALSTAQRYIEADVEAQRKVVDLI